MYHLYNDLSIGNHRVCHICSLRLRALYKNNKCALCKSDLHRVVFTMSRSLLFESYDLSSFQFDAKLSVYFETDQIKNETCTLLKRNCPVVECAESAESWPALIKHVKKSHDGKLFCEICTRNKKVFTHGIFFVDLVEHVLFSNVAALKSHQREGDPDDPSFKGILLSSPSGHPNCDFCNTRFYDVDALYEHCKKHETCFLCIRNGIRHQYHENYVELEKHFKSDHFLCPERECLEKKFVVFDSEIDLRGHQVLLYA